eukprot:gene971-19615_t
MVSWSPHNPCPGSGDCVSVYAELRMPAEALPWHLLNHPPDFVRAFAARYRYPLRAAVAALALLRTPGPQSVMASAMGISRPTFTAD